MKLRSEYNPQRSLEFIHSYSGISFDSLTPIDEVTPQHHGFPAQWRPLIGLGRQDSIDLLWDRTRTLLPHFCTQIQKRLIGLYFAESFLGPLLVYFLEQWDFNQKIDGTLYAGPPATSSQITSLEKQYGSMPPALPALWQTHGFIELRGAGNILSAGLSSPRNDLNIHYLGKRRSAERVETEFECLEIASCSKEEANAITRIPGQVQWMDHIVDANRKGTTFEPSIYNNLDELFVGYHEEIDET